METTSSVPEREPGIPLPPPPSRDRDGLSALERKALYRVHLEIAAMPPSLVVQILLWPEKITDWARDEGVTPALVYNMLGGFKPYHALRQRLADRLGVTKGAVDHLIDARRPQPSTRRIPDPPQDFSPQLPALEQMPLADVSTRRRAARSEHAAEPDAPPDAPRDGTESDPERARGDTHAQGAEHAPDPGGPRDGEEDPGSDDSQITFEL